MKRLSFYSIALLAAASFTFSGCNDDFDYGMGEGQLTISATINSDVKVESRTDAAELLAQYGESLELWITRVGEGPIRQYQGIDNVPTSSIKIPVGEYVAEAWAGDSVPASWDKKYFKAYVPFEITKNGNTPLEVPLKIANVLASVNYDANVDEVIKDYQMVISNPAGSLTFEGRDTRKGYYMMPQADRENLQITFTGTTNEGKAYTQKATISGVKPGHEYVVHVSQNGKIEPIGGAYFTITVDETEVEVAEEIVITLAPVIKGVDYDISQPLMAEEGKVGRVSVFVSSPDKITSLVLASADLQTRFGFPDIDLVTGAQSYLDQLAAAGINVSKMTDSEGVLKSMRINFEDEYTKTLANGEHVFTFTSSDGTHTASTALTINVSDAPIVTNDIDASTITFTSATVKGTLVKALAETPSRMGFNYRKLGTSTWTFVDGTLNGMELTANITGLTANSTYEFAAVIESFTANVKMFMTKAYPTIPNGGFEDWTTGSDKAIMPSASATDYFWDSGNHGSITMSKNVTQSDTSVKHSGNYSAKLASQFVGVGVIGKFAAGNLFVGQYLATEGTDGVLGWGRSFDNSITPKALKGYIKYKPVAVTSSSVSEFPKGTMDQGIIYVALVTDAMQTYNSEKWPCIVKTADKQFFNPTGSNVIWYGEKIFDETSGDGMVEFNIPLNAVNSGTWCNLIIVCSASRYGDYFTGGSGSTMWIDDLEFVY